MRIIAYRTTDEKGAVRLEESTGEFAKGGLDKLFAFLLEPYDDCIKVCWSLDQTVSVFLRLLGTAACARLRKEKRCHAAPFSVFYIPGKVFGVTHIPSRTAANLYGVDQFFPDLDEPEHLGGVQVLGEYLIKELRKMELRPTKLTSPVAIYEECVMKKLKLPQLKDLPLEAAEYAYRAAGRLWIETHTIGHFEKVWDYDLTSAFPVVVKDLADTRQCLWVHSSEYQADALYGYAKCKMTIYDWVMVSPIIMEIPEGLLSPVGTWDGYFTKGELDFVKKWGIGEWEIIDAWWAVPKTTLKYPFREPMEKLLEYKKKGELQALLAKRMAVGLYGRLGEEREDEYGPYFFPPWFAHVSTEPKLKVAEFLYQNGIGPGDNEGYSHLCHISVDGVMLDCPIEKADNKGVRLLRPDGSVAQEWK